MSKQISVRRSSAWVLSALSVAFASSLAAPQAGAEEEIAFGAAELFFELNNTDQDLGFHGKIDGEPWKLVTIENPSERVIMNVRVTGALRQQGMSEFSFESAEPPFDEVSPETVFARFPQGTYDVEGLTVDGVEMENEVEVSHVMPAPALATVNGEPLATQCDPNEPGYDAPIVRAPVTISWEPVTESHPDVGTPGVAVEIQHYEIVAESKLDINGAEFDSKFSAILPPSETSFPVPTQYIALGATFKYEVLARAANNNRTAVESCFVVQ